VCYEGESHADLVSFLHAMKGFLIASRFAMGTGSRS